MDHFSLAELGFDAMVSSSLPLLSLLLIAEISFSFVEEHQTLSLVKKGNQPFFVVDTL